MKFFVTNPNNDFAETPVQEEGRIIHVGIMLENQKIIHAHGKVRIDDLDCIGIFNKDQNKHTHKLRFVKRICPNP